MNPFLKEKAGITSYSWVPIDGYNGVNIGGRVDPGICSWYNGPSLFDIFNTCPIPKRAIDNAPIRIPVL